MVGVGSRPADEHIEHLAPDEHRRVREHVVLREPEDLLAREAREVGAERCVVMADLLRDDVEDGHALWYRRHRTALRVGGAHAPTLGVDERVPHDLIAHVAAEARARNAVLLVRRTVVVPQPLRRVDVVDRPQHLGVDALHVIGLAEAVGDHLPIAIRQRARHNRAPELVEVGPGRVRGDSLEVVEERHRSGVEVDEDEPRPLAHLHREERIVVVGDAAEPPA